MRSEYFLALPLFATAFNVLLSQLLVGDVSQAQPVICDGLAGRCDGSGGACETDLNLGNEEILNLALGKKEDTNVTGNTLSQGDLETIEVEDEQEEDPMLRLMAGTDFKAYVRADIATFYGKEPGSMTESSPTYNGQAGKFVNMSPERLDLQWEGHTGLVFIGVLGPWAAGGTASFPTHNFVMTPKNRPNEIVCRCRVVSGTSVYRYDPFAPYDHSDPARCEPIASKQVRSLDKLSDADYEKYEQHRFNVDFAARYKDFTGGSEWLTMFPRNPPKHFMYRADYFGQMHTVSTVETQFHTVPKEDISLHRSLSTNDMSQAAASANLSFEEYRNPGVMNITVKALSCAPRAFEVANFLSDAEVDHLLEIVNRHQLSRSMTGSDSSGHESTTRTSRNTWLPRHTDPVVDAIFRRVADVLHLDEALLRSRLLNERPDIETRSQLNEDIQIVHYDVGQEYTAHHDFGYPSGAADSPSRSINFCMYLNDTPKGGETSFPRWRNAEGGRSLDVKPEKGKAMIFYMINPDGNLDDLTHHAALPVIEGEKYFANLWIWDPVRR